MKKKNFLRKMRYILLVAMIAAMWMIAGGCGKKQKVLDVNKYLNISFEGYDGYGTMDCIFDDSKIDDDRELLPEDFSYYTMVYDLFSIDETSGLSNGDTVKISWNKDILEELSEKCDKAKLKYDDEEIEVKGLKEVDKIDMFSDLKVEYSGIAPNVSATCSSKKFPWVDFEIDKRENLSSGDTITVSIPESSINEEFIKKYKGVPAEMSKTFTVGDVPRYADKLADIPEDVMKQMDAQAQDDINAGAANWNEKVSLDSIKFIGNYFLTPKTSEDSGNILYLVYEITSTNPNETITFYRWYKYSNIVILEDGKCSVDVMDYKKTTGSYSWGFEDGDIVWSPKNDGNGYWYVGYKSIDSLFKKCVTAYVDKWKYESNIE